MGKERAEEGPLRGRTNPRGRNAGVQDWRKGSWRRGTSCPDGGDGHGPPPLCLYWRLGLRKLRRREQGEYARRKSPAGVLSVPHIQKRQRLRVHPVRRAIGIHT